MYSHNAVASNTTFMRPNIINSKDTLAFRCSSSNDTPQFNISQLLLMMNSSVFAKYRQLSISKSPKKHSARIKY